MKNQAANNGTFIPKPGFTVVQNSVARDWNLSSGALGLYTRIQSYITMERTLPSPKAALWSACRRENTPSTRHGTN